MAWTNVTPAVKAINQPTSSTCWYVCMQMLYIWKGRDPKEILDKLNADPDIYPEYWLVNGISTYNCLQLARCLGMGCAGDGEADAEVLANALRTHGPYWVAGEWKKGSPHVIVVTGCNPESGKIRLINPWNNYDLSESEDLLENFNNRGKVWGNTFGSMIYWSP